MNAKMIIKIAKTGLKKAIFLAQKYSPQLLAGLGIVSAGASVVTGCHATIKAKTIVEEHKETMATVHICAEDPEMSKEYSPEDKKKDTIIAYTQTAVKLVKTYAPTISLFVLAVIAILASTNILHKRNLALSAAYTAIETSFNSYRENVKAKYGEEVDKSMRYGIEKKKVDDVVTDPETGKTKKVKKEAFVVNPGEISGFARFFEAYTEDEAGNTIRNPYWDEDNERNITYIKMQERIANDILRSKGRVFLNDVYKMLGLPATKAGQIVGWVYNPDDKTRDNYIDFGLYLDNLSYSDYVNGHDSAILLDFNVDGNIWEQMA